MRLAQAVREALRSGWAAKIPSALIALVIATASFIAIANVGRSAAEARSLEERLDSPSARTLTIQDVQNAGLINSHTVGVIDQLSAVRAAAAFSPVDATNGVLGSGSKIITGWVIQPTHTRSGGGTSLLPAGLFTQTIGRTPQPGEALISAQAMQTLHMQQPAGYLVSGDSQYPVVGEYTARAPFGEFAGGAVIVAQPDAPMDELQIEVDSIANLPDAQRAALAILGPTKPSQISVDTPAGAAGTDAAVQNGFTAYAQATLALILAIGAVLTAAVVLTDVLIRRHDLGRRRTLGITRLDLGLIVALRSLAAGIVGSILGIGAALIYSHSQHITPPAPFDAAIAILASTAALLAAIPPALYAARRDPVAVMRTP